MVRRAVPILILLGVAAVSMLTQWTARIDWTPDALFYQAQSLELRGDSPARARSLVFDGAPGKQPRTIDSKLAPQVARYLSSPRWVRYNAPFSRRRRAVSGLTAALAPVFGLRSLEIASMLGYVAIGLLLYALLARRFRPTISVAVASIFLLVGPRTYSLVPLSDTSGLALLLLALIAGPMVLERGRRWLLFWILTIAMLSVTREDGLVAVVTSFWLAIEMRSRRTFALASTSVLAMLTASLLLGASLRESLARAVSRAQPPHDTSWSFVISHYWPTLRSTVHRDLIIPHLSGWYTLHAALWYAWCAVLVAGIVALVRGRGPDPYFRLIRAALLGGVAIIAISVHYSSRRLELVFLPPLAVGLALLLDALLVPERFGSRSFPFVGRLRAATRTSASPAPSQGRSA